MAQGLKLSRDQLRAICRDDQQSIRQLERLFDVVDGLAAAGGGATVADGDYIDVTVSDDGTTWTINPSGVTAGSYTNASVTIGADGRVTAASSGTGGGITELTGDVTAGPGSGLQTATIANDAVTTAKILDAAVTSAKMRNSPSLSLMGRSSNSAGPPEDILSATTGHVLRRTAFTLAFGTVDTAGITDDAITNAKAANMATQTIKGRTTAGTGDPEDLTPAQVRTMTALAPMGGLVSGGALTVNANPALFDLSAGSGYINGTLVSWSAFTAQTVTNLATATASYIYITSAGAILQATTTPTPQTRRANIFLGQLGHANLTSIGSAVNVPDVWLTPDAQYRDLLRCLGVFSCSGNAVSANGANLSIDISAGVLFGSGVNFHTDSTAPNNLTTSTLTAPTIRMRTQTGLGSSSTSIDPANYDVAGTITAMPAAKFQAMRVYRLVSGNVVIQYGQATYNSIDDAINGFQSESFVELENIVTIGALVCILVVKQGTTDLTDTTRARFVAAGGVGSTGGGGSGPTGVIGDSVTADTVLDATGVTLTAPVAALGTYLVTLIVMLEVVGGGGGDGATISENNSGGLTLTAANWALTAQTASASAYFTAATGTGALAFTGAATQYVRVEALIDITASGNLAFTIVETGSPTSATLLAGSGLSVTPVS